MKNLWIPLAVALSLASLTASVYSLDARELGVVTSFGKPVKTVVEPGLHLRAPWPLHQVQTFDQRAQLLSVDSSEILTRDKKNLVIQAFAVWRVQDPLRFLESVGDTETAAARLSDLVTSRIAASVGEQDFESLISPERGDTPLLPAGLLEDISEAAGSRFGVEIQALKLSQLGLPLQNEQSIYERMRAERKRIANAYRSEGEEQATAIRAQADREAVELTAAAEREAAVIQARGEAAATRLYTQAWELSPGLYRYLRQLDSYEAVLGGDDLLVLDSRDPMLEGILR